MKIRENVNLCAVTECISQQHSGPTPGSMQIKVTRGGVGTLSLRAHLRWLASPQHSSPQHACDYTASVTMRLLAESTRHSGTELLQIYFFISFDDVLPLGCSVCCEVNE